MNLIDLLFPKKCLQCSLGGNYLCDNCVSQVLDGTFDSENYSIFKYKGVIRKAITALKYKLASDISDELVEVSCKRLNSMKFKGLCLFPVPLHWQKKNFRGFNQSEILAEKISKKLNWKYIPELLVRSKKTNSQVGLSGEERTHNLNNAFTLNPKIDIRKLKEEKIIIFDDVYTTGSTIKEVKRVLKTAGFRKIYSLTIAR